MDPENTKAAPATATLLWSTVMVRVQWIKFPTDGSLAPPPELNYFQQFWWWRLLHFSLTHPPQGFLNVGPDHLWKIAGAHRPDFWDAKCTEVMTHWVPIEVEGRKVLHLPALLELVRAAQKAILEKKAKAEKKTKGEDFSAVSTAFTDAPEPSPSESRSVFDFSEDQNQLQNPSSTRARAPAEECARRMIEVLSLPSTRALATVIAAAVTAEADFAGISLEEAARFIARHAMQVRVEGVSVDRFFFEDAKWRSYKKSKSEEAASEYSARFQRELDMLRNRERT